MRLLNELVQKIVKRSYKVIFLDIDGVLMSYYNTEKRSSRYIDPKCIEVLNTVIDKTGAHVILSATARISEGKESVEARMVEAGFRYEIMDVTKNIPNAERGNEIRIWLQENSGVTNYVILDDEGSRLLLGQKDHYVWVDNSVGLTKRTGEKAVDILSRPISVVFHA